MISVPFIIIAIFGLAAYHATIVAEMADHRAHLGRIETMRVLEDVSARRLSPEEAASLLLAASLAARPWWLTLIVGRGRS